VELVAQGDGYVVNFAYGPVGGSAKTGSKTPRPVPLGFAEATYDALVAEKINGSSHYQAVNGAATEYVRPALAATHAHPVKCLPPRLLNDIDPNDIPHLIADPDWWLQIKHDGDRVQLHVQDGTVTLFSGRSSKVRAIPKAIAEARYPDNNVVLDGELVDDTLWVFDLMTASSPQEGEIDMRQLEYEMRWAGAAVFVLQINCPKIRLVETATTEKDKAALVWTAKERHHEGVVFVNKNAKYKAGRPNRGGDNLRWKFRASGSFIVAGHHRTKDSLDVKLHDGTMIGSVTMIGKERPPVGTVVEVEYLYCQSSLVQAVYKGVRTDVKPSACVRSQLQFKDGIDPLARRQ
jgi:bifunctional non-homologous end joining protein LigD